MNRDLFSGICEQVSRSLLPNGSHLDRGQSVKSRLGNPRSALFIFPLSGGEGRITASTNRGCIFPFPFDRLFPMEGVWGWFSLIFPFRFNITWRTSNIMKCYKVEVHTTNCSNDTFYVKTQDEYLDCEDAEFYVRTDDIKDIINRFGSDVIKTITRVGIAHAVRPKNKP